MCVAQTSNQLHDCASLGDACLSLLEGSCIHTVHMYVGVCAHCVVCDGRCILSFCSPNHLTLMG